MPTEKRRGVVFDPDRHGNPRWYFRQKGRPKVRLHEKPGTTAFDREVSAAQLGIPYSPAEKPAPDTRPRPAKAAPTSLRWLIEEYMRRKVAGQAPATRNTKRRVLDAMCLETTLSRSGRPNGEMAYRLIEPRHIVLLRDEKVGKPEAANHRIKVLSSMFAWAIEAGLAKDNPAEKVKKMPPVGDGHHTLNEDELARFEQQHPLGTKARLAFAIFRYTGLRVCDAAVFGRQHLYLSTRADGEQELRFRIRPKKTGNSSAVIVDMPVLPPLADAIALADKTNLTFLRTEFGKAFSEKGLGNRMRKWFDEAGLTHCSSHGIRKADATIAAENGATGHQLMGMLGWTTLKQAEKYTRAAQRKTLASAGAPHLLRRK